MIGDFVCVEHGLMFILAIAFFSYSIASTEYTFYWLIVDAGLPQNISEICAENRNNSNCAIYYDNVIPERIWISQVDSLRAVILTSFTCWLGGASDLIGRRKILLLNFCGCFISFFMAGILIYCDIHPIYLLLCSTVYELTGGLTVTIVIIMASIASQSEGSTRLYKLIGADVSLLLPSLIITPTGWWIKQYGLDYIYYIVFGSSVFVAIDWVLLLIFYSDQELIQIPTVTEYFRKLFGGLGKLWCSPSSLTSFLWIFNLAFATRLFASNGGDSVSQLYLQSPPLSWDSEIYSMYLTIGGICGLLAYVIAGLFGACKMPHFVIIYISYIAIISRNVLFGIVKNSTAIVGLLGFTLFESGSIAIMRTVMAEPVEKSLHGTLFVIPGVLQSYSYSGGQFTFSALYKLNAENPQWLYYMVVPGIMLISLFFLTLSHYIHSEKIHPLLQSSTSPPEDEEDQELIDSDENSESFSEFDPNATPLD